MEFEKAIITNVVVPEKDASVDLEIRYDDEVVTFILDGKKIFSGDLDGNFRNLFHECLNMWRYRE